MNNRNVSVPHQELIVKDGTIHIPSIFMFKGGCDELFPFLYGCRKENCIVIFDNEKITVDEDNPVEYQNLLLIMYISAMNKIGNDWIKYLGKIDDMKWDNVFVEEEQI